MRTYNLIGHCFIQHPKKSYLCTVLHVYAVYSLYTFSTFFPSEPSFLQQILKVQYILSMHISKMLLCRTVTFL